VNTLAELPLNVQNKLLAYLEGRIGLKSLGASLASKRTSFTNRKLAMKEGRIGRSKGGSVKRTK
tara:strand:- start:482 stop:673 length:192 start_codon:yes stop_codon:yes gene_type:complete